MGRMDPTPASNPATQHPRRRLLFHRDFQRYSGGHGKVWDYFGHALAHPAFQARAWLTPTSVAQDNPWLGCPADLESQWNPASADALFLGGMDWLAWPIDDPAKPVINLVQHLRHADPSHPLHAFLPRRAIRICVSQAVAGAILATGKVNGPVRVIEAALGLPDASAASAAAGTTEGHGPEGSIFIGALKRQRLGRELAKSLQAAGRAVDLVDAWLPRAEYLARLRRARVAVLLPNPTEGFYLPALEAMALGRGVVVLDCSGNRAYLEPGRNALVPEPAVDDLARAVAALDDPASHAAFVAAGHATAARFAPDRERRAFHAVLDDLDALWTA